MSGAVDGVDRRLAERREAVGAVRALDVLDAGEVGDEEHRLHALLQHGIDNGGELRTEIFHR
jgi:hypothetical protein